MEKILFLLAILSFSGCVGVSKRKPAALEEIGFIQSLSEDQLRKELWEKAGIGLEEVVFYVPSVIGIEALAKRRFVQKKFLGRGDRLDQEQQLTFLKKGDLFLGVNNVSFSTAAQKMTGDKGDAAIFLDADSLEVKVILIDEQYLEIQHQIISSALLAGVNLLAVTGVKPGGWAGRYQIEKGDLLIGKAVLREAQNQRWWLLGLIKAKKAVILMNKEAALTSVAETSRFLLEVFRDLGKFNNRNGDVMESETYLRVLSIRQRNFWVRELYWNRFLGLGIDFGCRYNCGAITPIIARIVPDSEVEKAGLRAGDEIAAVNGKPVKTAGEVLELARKLGPGAGVEFKIMRGLETFEARITIGWVVLK